jgi:uncharacterized YigZ family protein
VDTGGLKLNEGQYLSIAEPVDYECVITRSRFIASLRRATNRTEFERELQEITRLYPKATHHCWAYRFEAHPILEHSSDAGEPPGTAGRPMLGALKKYSLSNIMAVVTRYYGGVKLGVKGLISAYGGTLLMALEHAEIVEREPMSRLNFICTYDLYNILLSRLVKFQISQEMIKTEFAEHVSGEIQVPNSILTALTKELASISPGGRNLSYTLLPH